MLDLRTLCPLDPEAILAAARQTGKVLVAHEATRSAGVGAEVAAIVAERCFEHLDAPVRRLTDARRADPVQPAARAGGPAPARRHEGGLP